MKVKNCTRAVAGWPTALPLFAVGLLAMTVLSGCRGDTLRVENGLVIRNTTLISPERDMAITQATIVIQGDSVLYVGKQAVPISGSYQILDGRGTYTIPGLIDSHVHVSNILGMTFEQEEAHPDLVSAYQQQLPRSYLYFGFTTLIDLLGFPDRIQAFQRQPLHPDLYYAGPALVANGYPMHYLPESIRFDVFSNFLYLPSQASRIPAAYPPREHSPRAVVERIKKSGAIAVKTTYEPGFDTPVRLPVPSDTLLAQLREEAHRLGLPLVAHGNSLEAHQVLTRAKVDVIVHGLWNWGQYSSADTLPAPMQALLDSEIRANIAYMPTLQVIEGLKALFTADFLADAQLRHVLPSALINWYKTDAGQWFARQLIGDTDRIRLGQAYAQTASHGQRTAAYVAAHQGRILFGSDTPSAPTYGNPPGYNGYLEIQQLHRAGIPLSKILTSATIGNARAFHLDQKYGTVEKGKLANLLVLKKNPLTDVSAYDAIHTIILRGKPIQRASLSASKP